MMPHTSAIKRAVQVLHEAGVDRPPIDVFAIAESRGVRLRPAELGDDVSGLLLVKEGVSVIGYNSSHSKKRQRFTVAHELGHHELHRTQEELFIDKGGLVMYRDGTSSTGNDALEIEANAFAAELLMPRNLLEHEIDVHRLQLNDEKDVELLAKTFEVSVQAMTFRLVNLKILASSIL